MTAAFWLAAAATLIAQEYRFPIEPPSSGTQPYVTAYRDLDGGGGITDWSCGSHAYNGHRGTDIGIGGFAVMDAGSRWVVAAAEGEVTAVVDGCYDRCTSGTCDCGAGFGNYVKVTHADGKSTYYGHLKNGSVQVSRGQRVQCGERLGKVGSSGRSTGPHLHFEPRYSDNTSDDPFSGRCGGPVSFWVSQGGYRSLPGTQCQNQPPPPPPPPPPPMNGTVKGVVWDLSVTAGPSDAGNVRVPAATIAVDGGPSATGRSPDAYWTFDLPAGRHRITASAPGYTPETVEKEVRAGETVWSSIGLRPERPPERDEAEIVEESMPILLEVSPGQTFTRSWTLKNSGNTTWTDSGNYLLTHDGGDTFGAPAQIRLDPGESIAPGGTRAWTLTLTAPGDIGVYTGHFRMDRLGVHRFGQLLTVSVTVAAPPAQPEAPADDPPAGEIAPPQTTTPPTVEVKTIQDEGGCSCSAPHAAGTPRPWLALLLAAAVISRRRR